MEGDFGDLLQYSSHFLFWYSQEKMWYTYKITFYR